MSEKDHKHLRERIRLTSTEKKNTGTLTALIAQQKDVELSHPMS